MAAFGSVLELIFGQNEGQVLDAGGFDSMSEADVRSIVAVFVLPRSPITLAFCSLT